MFETALRSLPGLAGPGFLRPAHGVPTQVCSLCRSSTSKTRKQAGIRRGEEPADPFWETKHMPN